MYFCSRDPVLVSSGPLKWYTNEYMSMALSPCYLQPAVDRTLTTMTAPPLHTTLGLGLMPSLLEIGSWKLRRRKRSAKQTTRLRTGYFVQLSIVYCTAKIINMSDVAHAYSFELSQFRVPGPPEVYYIANFVTREEERYLLRKVRPTRRTQDFSAP